MTKKQTQEAHNAALKDILEDENHEHAETDAGLAGRFRAWLFFSFGDKKKQTSGDAWMLG